MLVLGAIIGKIFGEIVDIFAQTGTDFTVHWIVLGMAAYFVAVVRAPITGVILILEMTGSFHLLLALTTVAVVSFYVTELLGQQPVYEILYDRMKKDDNVVDEENQEKIFEIFSNYAEENIDFLKEIFSDVPHSMMLLKKSVEIVTRIGKEPWDALTQQADQVYQLGHPQLPEQIWGRVPVRVEE